MSFLSLNDIEPGNCAVVKRVHGTGSLKSRIMDMGITQGVSVKIRQCAPMGDPMQLRVRGYELSVRRSDAMNIEIEDLQDNCYRRPKTERKKLKFSKKSGII